MKYMIVRMTDSIFPSLWSMRRVEELKKNKKFCAIYIVDARDKECALIEFMEDIRKEERSKYYRLLSILNQEDAQKVAEQIPDKTLEEMEKDAILSALQKTNNRQNDAARLLNITPRVINHKIQHHKITHEGWLSNTPDKKNGKSLIKQVNYIK